MRYDSNNYYVNCVKTYLNLCHQGLIQRCTYGTWEDLQRTIGKNHLINSTHLDLNLIRKKFIQNLSVCENPTSKSYFTMMLNMKFGTG